MAAAAVNLPGARRRDSSDDVYDKYLNLSLSGLNTRRYDIINLIDSAQPHRRETSFLPRSKPTILLSSRLFCRQN